MGDAVLDQFVREHYIEKLSPIDYQAKRYVSAKVRHNLEHLLENNWFTAEECSSW